MLIKLLETCVVSGHPGVQAGDVFDCNQGAASYLLNFGKAVEWREVQVIAPPMVEIREPVCETREPGFTAAATPAIARVGKLFKGKSK